MNDKDHIGACIRHLYEAAHALSQLLHGASKSIGEAREDLRAINERFDDQARRIERVEREIETFHVEVRTNAEVTDAQLVKIDRDLQKMGRDADRDRLRRLARSLRGLWSDLQQTVDNPADCRLVGEHLEGFVLDAGLELIYPRAGEPFDSRCMTPVPGAEPLGCEPQQAVVETVVAPGFAHDDEIFECARVRLRQAAPRRPTLIVSSPSRSTNGNVATFH